MVLSQGNDGRTDSLNMYLNSLEPGQSASIVDIESGPHVDRVMEMGLVPGTQIMLVRRAAWGGPLQVYVRGVVLCIAPLVAQSIAVQLLTGQAKGQHT